MLGLLYTQPPLPEATNNAAVMLLTVAAAKDSHHSWCRRCMEQQGCSSTAFAAPALRLQARVA
jgi:hypothetical protein